MFRTKAKKIIMAASTLAVVLSSASVYAMSGDQNNVNKFFTTLAGKDTKVRNSTPSSSKVMFDKNGNVVDANGKIVMTAEKFKSNQSGAVMADGDTEVALTQDKDGNYVDKKGKIIITAKEQKERQKIIDEGMKNSEQENTGESSSKVMFDKDGNVVDTDGKIVMAAEKFKSNQSGAVMASRDGVVELMQDKDGNYVDENGKIIITAQEQKER